jgi:hypothetical protein
MLGKRHGFKGLGSLERIHNLGGECDLLFLRLASFFAPARAEVVALFASMKDEFCKASVFSGIQFSKLRFYLFSGFDPPFQPIFPGDMIAPSTDSKLITGAL